MVFTRNIISVSTLFHTIIVWVEKVEVVVGYQYVLFTVYTSAAVGTNEMLGSTSDHIALIAAPLAVNVRW
jgi:hypothetical protein